MSSRHRQSNRFFERIRSRSTGRSPENNDFLTDFIPPDEIDPNPPTPTPTAPPLSEPPTQITGTTSDMIQTLLNRDYEKNERYNKLQKQIETMSLQLSALQTSDDPTFLLARNKINPPEFSPNGLDVPSNSLQARKNINSCFSNIPIFESHHDIRSLLEALNYAVNDSNMKLTERLFKSILLSKLSHSVRKSIGYSEDKTVAQLYDILLGLYDVSETPKKAVSMLFSLRGSEKIRNFNDWLIEARRLLHLTGQSLADQAQSFVIALQNILPEQILWKIEEYLHSYKRRNGGYPSVENVSAYVSPFREHLDEYIQNQSKQSKLKIRSVDPYVPQPFDGLPPNPPSDGFRVDFCSYCNRRGHSQENCFKKIREDREGVRKKICGACGREGHTTDKCRSRCRMCNDFSHTSPECPIYVGQIPTQDRCPECFSKVHLSLYHPREKCHISLKN